MIHYVFNLIRPLSNILHGHNLHHIAHFQLHDGTSGIGISMTSQRHAWDDQQRRTKASTSTGNENMTAKQCSFSRPSLILEHTLLLFQLLPDLVYYSSTVYYLRKYGRFYFNGSMFKTTATPQVRVAHIFLFLHVCTTAAPRSACMW